MRDELPTGWTEATLGQVALINPPGASTVVADDEQVSFVPMAAVEELSGRMKNDVLRPFGEVKKGFTRFRDGDVLFAKITPCMENGKIAVARGLRGGVGCGSTEFHVLRPHDSAEAEYLRHFLVRSAYRREAQRNMQGAVGQQRVPTDYLRESVVPLPPKAEQQRIVSRIEELFSEIDEGERALERVGQLVERYRQSVLKAAVTGELTVRDRAAGRFAAQTGAELLARTLQRRVVLFPDAAGRPAAAPATVGAPDLPAGWAWASLDQLCRQIGNGLSRKPAHEPPGTPILRISAVRPLAVNASDHRYYQAEPGERLDGFAVECGDLLFTRYNGSRELVGVSGVYRGQAPVLHPDKLIKARVVSAELVVPDYLEMALNAGASWQFLTSCVKTSAGQHGIAGADIKRVPIPLPSFEEQRRIVELWRQFDAQSLNMKASAPREVRRAHALRQSILKAAFSGQLVPQDPNDEPASALLARLAAQSAAAPPAPRRRGRKVPS